MGVSGPSPLQSEKGFSEYLGHFGLVRRRVRVWITRLPETNTTDNGFMASVMALRVLAEGAPNVVAITIAKGEVDYWQQCYLEWFERMKRRFPKKVDAEAVKTRALEEFAKLREIGVNLPDGEWKSSTRLDLKTAEKEDALRAQAREAVLAENAASVRQASAKKTQDAAQNKWHPCRLVTFPESMGDPRYSLSFSQFSELARRFKALKIGNDGYSWQRLVELHLAEHAPEALAQISFDSESSMFCARSSAMPALEAVHAAIVRIHSDEQTQSQLLRQLQAEQS